MDGWQFYVSSYFPRNWCGWNLVCQIYLIHLILIKQVETQFKPTSRAEGSCSCCVSSIWFKLNFDVFEFGIHLVKSTTWSTPSAATLCNDKNNRTNTILYSENRSGLLLMDFYSFLKCTSFNLRKNSNFFLNHKKFSKVVDLIEFNESYCGSGSSFILRFKIKVNNIYLK